VYSHHDRRLIIASSLALTGYITDEAVREVINSRLDNIYEVVKTGTYDIFEKPGEINIRPPKWANQIVKRGFTPMAISDFPLFTISVDLPLYTNTPIMRPEVK